MKALIKNFLREESAQDLIEYTLLLAFVALASASLFLSAGNSIQGIWVSGANTISTANTAATLGAS